MILQQRISLCAIGLLLITLLPMLEAGPAQLLTLDSNESLEEPESDWQLGRSLVERLSNEEAESGYDGEAPQLQVEATKKLWIEELMEKADNPEETADLIDEIRSRTSSSGLRSLKAACKAMCAKCICGVILLPSLPSVEKVSRATLPLAAPKKPAKPTKKPRVHIVTTKKAPVKIVTTRKPEAPKVTKKPEAPKVTRKPEAPKVTLRPAALPQPTIKGSNPAKKAKKWLNEHEINLPDFLLDEESSGNVYKREVDDHDPLAASHRSEIGIE